MDRDTEALTPFMQRVRSQVEVLVPLLRHLRAELGEVKANELVYPALREAMKKWIVEIASSDSDNPVENFKRTSDTFETMYDGDVEYETLRDDDERWDLDMYACRYADLFRQLDEPELGTILVCEMDDHIADLAAPAVKMSRTQTIMKGGTHCPFRYRFGDANGDE